MESVLGSFLHSPWMLLGPIMLLVVGPALRRVFLRECIRSRDRVVDEEVAE